MSPISAVIFDLDGTLLDTLADIAGAMNAVLRTRGLPPHPVEAYKEIVGEGIDEAVRKAFALSAAAAASAAAPSAPPPPPPPLAEEEIASIIRDYRLEYAAAWRLNSRPYPEIPPLLDALADLGVKAAVLSNKSHLFTEAMTRELLPGHRFAAVRGALPGRALKPDPSEALAIAADIGAPPSSCIFLGDTKVDMLTAVAAGMFPVGALWGFRSGSELLSHGAAAVISSPLELLGLLAPFGG